MLRLVLMRHAKSDWGDPGLGDHDRPLNDRGRRAAPRMGAWLAAQGAFPDAALLSSARRVQETWAGVLDGAGRTASPPPARTERGLYLAEPEEILAALRAAPATARTVLMLGHEPGTPGMLARMQAGAPPPALAWAFDRYPTASVSILEVDAPSWAETNFGAARIIAHATPKSLA